MAFTDNPLFLRTLARQPDPDLHEVPRERLRSALFKLRERAEVLAGEIHRDLPDFTVHDITHLDALWEMADLIAGPDYPLNPMEAFALGAVFLIHDLGLGLAAYPGGVDELKKGTGWQDALSTYLRKHLERIPTAEELASPPAEVERMAIQERLRVLHAEQAERLALATWSHKGGPEYHLIEDPDLRQAIGPLLGKIAHSHWWPVSRLGSELSTIRGALSTCPGDWTLDPLKIAALLRTADAAHLDARRAPGFLIALRRPEGISEDHWRFQNRLLKPRVEEDRLVYTTAAPFPPEEVDSWWLCEETLRMVDREFHQVDALLADRGGLSRLRVHGVAGAESPQRLQQYIEASGWTPVDARLHVSNVADLARKLGGEQLYGDDPTVPLRELIQNASDAVRARRLLEKRPSTWGRVTVRIGRDHQGSWVEVEDTGIGMSEAVLAGPLLDFGTTYWGSGLMREEHEGLWAKGFAPIGFFGIGFFSVFMWGHRVRVITRRYEGSQKDTQVLEFRTGVNARPLIRPAEQGEYLKDGGTCVRVWMETDPNAERGFLSAPGIYKDRFQSVSLEALCAWLAPALDVDLFVDSAGTPQCVVSAFDWLDLDEVELISRFTFGYFSPQKTYKGSLLSKIMNSDGEVLGRGAFLLPELFDNNGGDPAFWAVTHGFHVITVGGLRILNAHAGDWNNVHQPWGMFGGVPSDASRNRASLLADKASLAAWASEQADLAAVILVGRYNDQESYSEGVVACGGNPGILVIGKMAGNYITLEDIKNWRHVPDEMFLVYQSENLTDDDLALRGLPSCVIWLGSQLFVPLVESALASIWNCSVKEIMHVARHGIAKIHKKSRECRGTIIRKPKYVRR